MPRRAVRFLPLWTALCFLPALSLRAGETPPAADALRERAGKGEIVAQLELGREYFSGLNGRSASPEQAAYWFRRAAQAESPEGMFNFAICLQHGIGVNSDQHQALALFRRAAAAGIVPARMMEAQILLAGIAGTPTEAAVPPDPERARQLLEELATAHYAPAERELGLLKLRGDDAPDAALNAEILQHFLRAAEAGDVVSCRLAAGFLLRGAEGIERDEARARQLLAAGAEGGDAEALAQLAFCAEFGLGAEADAEEAFRLYSRAAAAGVPAAQLRMGEYYFAGDRTGGIDTVRGVAFMEKAATAGLPAALTRLGGCYAEGLGVKTDRRRAADYFLQAARLGDREGQFNLGCMFLKGDGIPEDRGAAFFWFKQAAENGDVRAQRQLAYCYFEGIGITPDEEAGLRWLKTAAENGDVEAMKLLLGE